jgi:N-acyl amino acid synthase FeeM
VAHFRVPALVNPNTAIQVATSVREVRDANRLVFRNYVGLGYWRDDAEDLNQNRYLNLSARHVVVICEAANIVGTVSLVVDSVEGLPADSFRPDVIRRLRRQDQRIAEISAFAIVKDRSHQYNLFHFLMAFILQYGFHYLAIDQFVAVCTPRHARFYEAVYGFRKMQATSFYDYVKVEAQMLTLDLIESYKTFERSYRAADTSSNFFRFLYRNEHPSLRFPPHEQMRRPRNVDWSAYAKALPLAV